MGTLRPRVEMRIAIGTPKKVSAEFGGPFVLDGVGGMTNLKKDKIIPNQKIEETLSILLEIGNLAKNTGGTIYVEISFSKSELTTAGAGTDMRISTQGPKCEFVRKAKKK